MNFSKITTVSRRFLLVAGLLACPATSHALPTLQLDIGGGTYDAATETIVAPSSSFTLYAYLIPDRFSALTDKYFVSAALSPKAGPADSSLGSFTFNGTTVNATSDMIYGVPPVESIASLQGWDASDLGKHGIFPTYFSEFAFQFSATDQITPYNTQDRADEGDPIPSSGSGMYYVAFNVNTSALDPSYVVHFDLYNTVLKNAGDVDASQFAPFSHDAESSTRRVPEPSALLLIGIGMLGVWKRSFNNKA